MIHLNKKHVVYAHVLFITSARCISLKLSPQNLVAITIGGPTFATAGTAYYNNTVKQVSVHENSVRVRSQQVAFTLLKDTVSYVYFTKQEAKVNIRDFWDVTLQFGFWIPMFWSNLFPLSSGYYNKMTQAPGFSKMLECIHQSKSATSLRPSSLDLLPWQPPISQKQTVVSHS
jgi:hypothetical protein